MPKMKEIQKVVQKLSGEQESAAVCPSTAYPFAIAMLREGQ